MASEFFWGGLATFEIGDFEIISLIVTLCSSTCISVEFDFMCTRGLLLVVISALYKLISLSVIKFEFNNNNIPHTGLNFT